MNNLKRALQITAAALALGACAPSFEPAPDYRGGYLWDNGQSRRVTVEPGDTIYAISRRYDVPIRVIAARNGIAQPYGLIPGQVLILDPVRTHHVAAGETLQSIADKYQVPRDTIADVNDLRPPYQVATGQELWIPDPFTVAAGSAAKAPEPPPPVAAPRPRIMTSNLAPPPGATALPGSPGAPAITTLPPPMDNGQPPPMMTVPPQPDTAALSRQIPADTAPIPPAPLPRPPATPPQPAPPPVPPTEAVAAMPPPVAPPQVAAPQVAAPAAAPAQQAALPPATEPHFVWPVKGRLLSGFGPAGQGLHNDGINIAAPQGTQVRAADAGEVAYAGDGLKSFGNLLLIRHENGLTTAYGHNDKLLVSKGDKVKQGQVIATVGKSGNVDKPQLHFEVRRGTQAVDPQPLLNR